MTNISDEQKQRIDARIKRENLNQYGDSKDTMYAGGDPLFDMRSGMRLDRYEYIASRHPDWLKS